MRDPFKHSDKAFVADVNRVYIGELEQFCSEHGFLYHAHGSGKWGSERYWSYYKVENNDRTVFSIEYFPVSGTARISIANNRYQGGVESVAHLLELMAAMRIPLDDSEVLTSQE